MTSITPPVCDSPTTHRVGRSTMATRVPNSTAPAFGAPRRVVCLSFVVCSRFCAGHLNLRCHNDLEQTTGFALWPDNPPNPGAQRKTTFLQKFA